MKWYRINESAVTSAMGTVIGLGKSLGNSDLKMDTNYKTNEKTWALDKSHMPFDSISKVLSRLSTEKYKWEYIESQKAFYLKKTFNTSKVKSLFGIGRTNIENECRIIYKNTRKELTNFIDSNPELNENISFFLNWVDMKEEDVSDRQFYLFGSDGIRIIFVGDFNKINELRKLSKKVFDESSSNFRIGDKLDEYDEYDEYEGVDELSVASIKEYFNWNLGEDMHTNLSRLPSMLEDKWDGIGGFDKAKTKIISLEDDKIDFVVKGSNDKFFDVAISNPFDIFVDEISKSEYMEMVRI